MLMLLLLCNLHDALASNDHEWPMFCVAFIKVQNMFHTPHTSLVVLSQRYVRCLVEFNTIWKRSNLTAVNYSPLYMDSTGSAVYANNSLHASRNYSKVVMKRPSSTPTTASNSLALYIETTTNLKKFIPIAKLNFLNLFLQGLIVVFYWQLYFQFKRVRYYVCQNM